MLPYLGAGVILFVLGFCSGRRWGLGEAREDARLEWEHRYWNRMRQFNNELSRYRADPRLYVLTPDDGCGIARPESRSEDVLPAAPGVPLCVRE